MSLCVAEGSDFVIGLSRGNICGLTVEMNTNNAHVEVNTHRCDTASVRFDGWGNVHRHHGECWQGQKCGGGGSKSDWMMTAVMRLGERLDA